MKLVSVAEMKAVEREADASGLSYDQMMENAGHNLAREVLQLAYVQEEDEELQVLGLVGSGNNGGDTLVALAHLAEKGWTARAYLVKRKAEKDPLITRLEGAEGEIYQAEKDTDFIQLQSFLEAADVVLDGVLGTGFKLPLKEEVGRVLTAVRQAMAGLDWPPMVVAVDCPSGVDCDSGQAAPETIPADATVTMAAVKTGLLKVPAFDLVGELRVVEIGELDGVKAWRAIGNQVADIALVSSLLPVRPADAHKGTFGTALVAAGSVNYTGAALLSGRAAYRIGSGLVTLAIPALLHAALAGHLPEATWVLLPHELGVISAKAAGVLAGSLEHVTAMLLGPGFGMEDTTGEFLADLLKGAGTSRPAHGRMGFVQGGKEQVQRKPYLLPPLVIDADGLKLLAKITGWPELLPAPAVLTPHPGEMAALTGLSVDMVQKDRLSLARKYAMQWGHVVVLKGAFSVVAAPDGRTTTIPVASPALARAGSGDVLAGLITGLRAQGIEAYDAARIAAWVHAQAGLAAAQALGSRAAVLAGDILEAVPDVLSDIP